MIRWQHVVIVWQKELKDLMRDKVTIAFLLGFPFFLFPALFLVMGEFIVTTQAQKKKSVCRIHLYEKHADAFHEAFRSSLLEGKNKEVVKFIDFEDSRLADIYEKLDPSKSKQKKSKKDTDPSHTLIEKWIQTRGVDAIVMIKKIEFDKWSNHHVFVLYDRTSPTSKLAYERILANQKKLNKKLRNTRLDEHGLQKSFFTPSPQHSINVATLRKTVNNILGPILPILLVLFTVINVFHTALTLTCSEKENGTLATLLCTPVHHLELIYGKFLTLLLISLVGLFANVMGLVFSTLFIESSFIMKFMPSIHELSLATIVLLPVSMLYCALFLCVSILPKTYREGGNYLTPIIILALAPTGITALEHIKLDPVLALVPICNASLLLRELFVSPVSADLIALCMFSNVLWTFALLFTASVFFSREDILLGENLRIYDIFTFNRNAFPRPTPGTSVIAFLLCFCIFFYLSKALLGMSMGHSPPWLPEGLTASLPLLVMAIAQFCVILTIPLGFSRYFKMSAKEVFSLKLPPLKSLLGGLCLGASMFYLATLSLHLVQPPSEFMKQMESAIFGDGERHWLLLLFCIAIVPAVCEEFAFRGFILRGFANRLSPGWSIFLSSLLFAFMHFSIYRFLPTFMLGLVLGFALWRSQSLVTCIIMHAMNNAIGVILYLNQDRLESLGLVDGQHLHAGLALIFIPMIVLGLWLLNSSRSRADTN